MSNAAGLLVTNSFDIDVLPFFDSWGRIPSGLLYGHSKDLGNYDQCVSASVNTGFNGIIANGQYCSSNIAILLPLPHQELTIGTCIPAACDASAVSRLLTNATGFDIILTGCSTKEKERFRPIDWVAIAFFSILAGLMLLSTCYDYITNCYGIEQKKIWLAFSAITNSRQLFSISVKTHPNSIDCLNGLRVFSNIWVIFFHTFQNRNYEFISFTNFIDIPRFSATLTSLLMHQSATASVDTFLFISGLLISWTGLKEFERTKGRVNVPLAYFHRLVRIMPSLAITIFFIVTLFRYCGDGPLWSLYVDKMVPNCEKNWWKALLFIHNYYSPKEMCHEPSWYLAADMQLYIFSPLIMFSFYKWGYKVISYLAVLCLLSAGCLIATFYKYQITGLLSIGNFKFAKTYVPTHLRYSPWLIGLGFGYILYKTKSMEIRISKAIILWGWLIAFAIILAIVFGPYPTMQLDYNQKVFQSAFFDAFKKIGWSLALAWIVFACHRGYGGPINSILSYPFWQVMGRLAYPMYLTHWIVRSITYGNARTDFYFSVYEMISQLWTIYGITLSVSIVILLAFEMPVIALENLYFGKTRV